MLTTFVYEGDECLDEVLELALQDILGRASEVNCWFEDEPHIGRTLRFGFQRGPSELQGWAMLPAPLKAAEVLPLVQRWLDTVEYPEPPNTDGSVKRGFHVDCGGLSSAMTPEVLLVRPHWTVYGK